MENGSSNRMLKNPEFWKRTSCSRFLKVLNERTFPEFPADKVEGKHLTSKWLKENDGFKRPVLVEGGRDSFRLHLPEKAKTVSDILKDLSSGREGLIGDVPVKLIEVGTQSEIEGYTIAEFAEYLEKRTEEHKVLNLISLEFSSLPLSKDVQQPRMVKSIDWIDNVWPIDRRTKFDYPQVQKYCLTGMAGSYTDFHIDFGGTSVWYHVVTGKKRFFLVPPTSANLFAYEKWTCSANQDSTFFGDLVPNQCFYIDLCAGQTMMIPSVWIHSVYTPEDSLVFGGNFLHSYSIYRQLQAHSIEDRTRVNKIYRFPHFRQICFYALTHLMKVVSTLTNGYDKSKLREITYLDVFGSELIYKQFPYLLKSCDLWLPCASLDDSQRFDEAAVDAGIENSYGVITFWWEVMLQLAKNHANKLHLSGQDNRDNVHENFSERFDDFYSHIENIKNSSTMPDVLSEDNARKALPMKEVNIPWSVLYQEAMKNGNFRRGCDKPSSDNFKPAPEKAPLSSSSSKFRLVTNPSIQSIKQEQNDIKNPQLNLSTSLQPQTISNRPTGAMKYEESPVHTSDKSNEREMSGGQYATRGKRLSANFLRDHTDADLTSENEDNWESCPIWSKQVTDKKQRYLNQLEADARKEEEEYGKNENDVDEDEEDFLDEQDDEEAKYLRKAAKKVRASPSGYNNHQISMIGATVKSTPSTSRNSKPTTIRQSMKKLLKRRR